MSTFEDILNRNSDDIKPPPVLPQGPYHTIIVGLPEQVESSKQKTPGFKFVHKIVSPLDGVDEEAIAQIDGGVIGKEIENTLWVTEKSAFMLKDFLINLGIELEGRSMMAALDEVPNREIVIFIKHELIGEGDSARPIAKVGKTAPVE